MPTCTIVVSEEKSISKAKKKIVEDMDRQGRDDPFYIISVDQIVKKYMEWTKNLPRITPYYAMKCNSQKVIIQALTKLGAGLDVATKGEMDLAVSLGIPESHLIYSNTVKATSNLLYAKKIGVRLTVFDSETELLKIKTHHPSAELLVRLTFDDPNAVIHMGQHFGCQMEVAKKLLDLARELGLNVVGVCFHIGCGSRDPQSYSDAILEAKKIFTYSEEQGRKLTLLDIGGGFPGSLGDLNIPLSQYAEAINGALNAHFPMSSGIEVIAEPGQYFAATAQSVFVNVIGIKQNYKTGHRTYILSDGMHGSFRDVVTFKLTPDISVPKWYEFNSLDLHPCDLWGPSCDPMDELCEDYLLPDMKVGQWLEFSRMGAYTNELFCNFNGFSKPDTFCVVTPDQLHLVN